MQTMNTVVNKHAWKRFDECNATHQLKRRAFWHNVAMRTSKPPMLRDQVI